MIKEWFRRLLGSTRSFDAATGGRRGRVFGTMPSQLSAQVASRFTLASRARYLVANNSIAAAAVDGWVSAIVGTGMKPQALHPAKTIRERLNVAWEDWTDRADLDNVTDLYGLQALMVRRMVVDGEAFAIMVNEGNELRVRLIDPEQVSKDTTKELPDGGYIVSGVEFDRTGRRVAYHIRRHNVLKASLDYQTDRVAAADVLHLYRIDTPGQVRGITWFAPVMSRIANLDTWLDAQLMKQAAASMLVGVVHGGDAVDGAPFEGEALGDTLEPGTIKVAPPGSDVTFSNPPAVGMDAIEFAKILEREIAAGIGLPAWFLSQDLSQANYGSQRGGLIEFRRRTEQLQYGILVYQVLRPLWRRWSATEIMSGRIKSRFEDAGRAKWIAPKVAWIDPLKDSQAEVIAISSGLMSRREAVASRGIDIEQLDQEIAADNARAKALGLTFTSIGADNRPEPEQQAA